jgi:probable addiction module antidote protein
MTKIKTTKYDVAGHLRTPEEMAAYLEACIEEANGDAAFIAKALGDIARAKGMSQVARDAGLSRESLYKALSGERSPSFDTILKVIGALGLGLRAEVLHTKAEQIIPRAKTSPKRGDGASR